MESIAQEQILDEQTVAHSDARPARTLADLPAPKGLPLVGNMFQIDATKFHQSLEKWADEFGPLYKFKIGRKQILIIADHNLIGTLLRDRPDAIRRSTRTSGTITDLGIRGVFSDEGDEWRKQRKLVMRALTPEVIRSFFPTLAGMTGRMLHRWHAAVDAGQPVDMLRDLKAFALDVTIGLAMGQDINALEHDHNPLQRDIEFIFTLFARRVTAPFAYWHYFKLPIDREADRCVARIRQAIAGFIAQTRQQLLEHPERRLKPTNMMEALIVARDEPGSEFTDDHVIGNAITMVFAGEDTTSNTIAWLLNFVARDQAVATRIAAEADAMLNGEAVLQAFDALDRFGFTEAATSEAMRLKPVAPLLGLETLKEMMIGDVLVPQGTVMLACMRHAALQEEHFPLPEMFLPERWLSNQFTNTNADPARKLFPFGGGARFCPGRFLAMTEIKMVVSMIVRNFTIAADPHAPPVEEQFTFTMTPSSLPVRLARRNNG